jgi:4-alpha-glucanotransferase
LWQVLPLSPPGFGNSPYSAISAFAGNPLLISLERLADRGWITHGEVQNQLPQDGRINFDDVKAFKLPRLRKAALNFMNGGGNSQAHGRFADFKRENAWWLDDYVLFLIIRRNHRRTLWNSWPAELARRSPQALQSYAQAHAQELEVERAIQFAFFEQWRALHHYSAQRAIRIVGDVAIFVNYDSADVWCNPHLFHLDGNLAPTVVAGVPPDLFSESGQRWGNPLYNWEMLRQQNYEWWVQRMAWSLKTCDVVRLDHFRGFESYWEIPAHEPTAIHGHWVPGPSDDLFRVLRERLGDLPFIAEDLGLITPAVHALRERLGVPGMKVLQFGFGDPGAHIYLPHNFSRDFVVYTGTHDNDTTLGWWQSGASEAEKQHAAEYFGRPQDGINWAMIRAACASVADMALVPMQDVLSLGSDARMNVPSRPDGNWGWRFAPGMLTNELADKLAALAAVTDRLPRNLAGNQNAATQDFAA